MFIFVLVNSILGNGQSRGDRFSDRSINSANSTNSIVDTVDRPNLTYNTFLLSDFEVITSNIDTSIGSVHLVEPYYQDLFLAPNLGSENSARASSYLSSSKNAIRLDNSSYQRLFDQTEEASLVKVNRSFWQLHYGSGQRIGGSNLIARFYRPFARNIDFNFNFHRFSDNGMSMADQGNSFQRIDLKLAQRSKGGKRMTYIHYDRPAINENVSTLNDEGVIVMNRSDQSFTLGNQIILRDSATAPLKGNWKTKLKYFKKTYTVTSSRLDSVNIELLPFNLQESSLSYKNELKGLQFGNELTLAKFGGDVSFSIDANTYTNVLGDSISNNYFEGILGVGFDRKINANITAAAAAKIGFADGSGYVNVNGNVTASLSNKINLNANFEFGKNIQSLEKSQLFINDTTYQNNDWNSLSHSSLSLKLKYLPTDTKVEVGYKNATNAVLVNRFGLFDQVADPIGLLSLKVEQGLRLGPFHTRHGVLFQSISNDRLTVPELNYSGKIFFNLWLFKKKMYTQLGADVYFIPSYDTPEFYALTGEFYNRDVTSRSSNIFVVNPYFNAKVGPFLFFIKAINSTYILFPSSYTTINDVRVAQYDQALTTNFDLFEYRFKFGFKWTLLD